MSGRPYVMWLCCDLRGGGAVHFLPHGSLMRAELEVLRRDVLTELQQIFVTGVGTTVRNVQIHPTWLSPGILLLTFTSLDGRQRFIPCLASQLQLRVWSGVAAYFEPAEGSQPNLRNRFISEVEEGIRGFLFGGGSLPALRYTPGAREEQTTLELASAAERTTLMFAVGMCVTHARAGRCPPELLLVDLGSLLRIVLQWCRLGDVLAWCVSFYSADGQSRYYLFTAHPIFALWDGVLAVFPDNV